MPPTQAPPAPALAPAGVSTRGCGAGGLASTASPARALAIDPRRRASSQGSPCPPAVAPPARSVPPWATHGEEAVPRSVLRKGLSHRQAHHVPSVQFRGVDSLASLHLIDRDMPPDVRLSQKLATTGGFGERTLPRSRLPAVSEVQERLGTTVTSMDGTTEGAKPAAEPMESTRRMASSAGRRPSTTPAQIAPPSTSKDRGPANVSRGAQQAQPPWLALATASRGPSRDHQNVR
ncbi:unnamed protein product [Polarella glacialis]|uniref:Uncharacterized protein n=1 Tax=Polarella glacialis TaxID=89957 RepID=A0A813EDK4_POLGL|nr:unnamed protein product [Polarella glacialis]CAE8645083.1 unnamed protein product [Polarella glacialis]